MSNIAGIVKYIQVNKYTLDLYIPYLQVLKATHDLVVRFNFTTSIRGGMYTYKKRDTLDTCIFDIPLVEFHRQAVKLGASTDEIRENILASDVRNFSESTAVIKYPIN